MNTIKKSRLIGIFLVLTVMLFQFQSILAVSELDTLRFTAYKLGGSGDEMDYGNGPEWGRGNLILHSTNPDSSFNVGACDNFTIKFSVHDECQPFYCIELGAPLSDINGEEYTKNNKSYWDNISNNGKLTGSQINDYLGRVLYYGFHDEFTYTDGDLWNVNYANNASKINQYIATQILIWETIYAYRDANFNYVSWPGLNCPLDCIASTPQRDAIIDYYNSIVYRVKNCSNIPSFMYSTYEDAISNPYEIPFSDEQQLFATTMNDQNSKITSYLFSYDDQKIYIDNQGSSSKLNVSLPKNTTATKNNPLVISLNDPSYYSSASVITWTSGSKQNGITWGSTISVPVTGFAAFYAGKYDKPKTGSISITKSGEAFTEIKNETIGNYNVSKPVFNNIKLENISFSLYAYSDIYLDDKLMYVKDELIETKKTDKQGNVSFSGLGAGVYRIEEVYDSNNSNYVRLNDSIIVELDWNRSLNAVDDLDITVDNLYKKAKVDGLKLFEQTDPSIKIDMNKEKAKVKIGLYTNEDLYGYNGIKIPKDTLIDVASINSKSKFEFEAKLPEGNYYIKELEGSEYFVIDNEIHYFSCSVSDYEEVTLNTAPIIINESTEVTGWKLSDNRMPLKGAVIALYTDKNCTNEISKITTNEDGYFVFKDLPAGTYFLKELQAPKGYEISSKIYQVTSHKRGEGEDVTITNIPIISTPTPTPTPSSTPSPTPTPSNTPSPTPTPTCTPTPTPTVTPTPTSTPTPTISPTPTITVTPTPTNTPSPTPTVTVTPTPTDTPSPTPTVIVTPTPTETPSPTPTATVTPTPVIDTPPGIIVTPTLTPTPTTEILITPEITTVVVENPPKFDKPKSDTTITATGEKASFTTALGKSILLSLILTFIISKSYTYLLSKYLKE